MEMQRYRILLAQVIDARPADVGTLKQRREGAVVEEVFVQPFDIRPAEKGTALVAWGSQMMACVLRLGICG